MDASRSAALIEHLEVLTALPARIVRLLRSTPLETRLAAIPDWTLGDLGTHLGSVCRRAAKVVSSGQPADRTVPAELPCPVPEWCESGWEDLLGVLGATDPERSCWTFDPNERTVRWWHRRQLHETVVHLWDARSAADPDATLGDIEPAVCADGLDELLTVFPARVPPGERGELPGSLALHAGDADRHWLLRPDWTLVDGAGLADAEITGSAEALLLHGWRRRGADAHVRTGGDPAVLAAYRSAPFVP
jgi:uncharacterized protein (TIGR03083 family)